MQVNVLPADITQRLPGIGQTAGIQRGVSEGSFLAGRWWSRTHASWMRTTKVPGLSVGRLWRNSAGGFGSGPADHSARQQSFMHGTGPAAFE
jgi:hypothetical protein